jgi:hypothetical protein
MFTTLINPLAAVSDCVLHSVATPGNFQVVLDHTSVVYPHCHKKGVPITYLLVHSALCQRYQPRPGSSTLPLWSSLSRVLPSTIAVLQL